MVWRRYLGSHVRELFMTSVSRTDRIDDADGAVLKFGRGWVASTAVVSLTYHTHKSRVGHTHPIWCGAEEWFSTMAGTGLIEYENYEALFLSDD